MIKRILQAAVLCAALVLIPAAFNLAALRAPHLWVLLGFGILASLLQPPYNPFAIAVKPGDKGTGAMIVWFVYATQIAAVLEAVYLRFPQSLVWDAVSTGAAAAMLVGLGIRTWAVATLGGLFTMHLDIRPDHRIVERGPYRWVRHPSYLGAFIMYVATALMLHAWFSAGAAALLLPVAFARRIRHEETMLRQAFGADYDAYCGRVRKIIPGLRVRA